MTDTFNPAAACLTWQKNAVAIDVQRGRTALMAGYKNIQILIKSKNWSLRTNKLPCLNGYEHIVLPCISHNISVEMSESALDREGADLLNQEETRTSGQNSSQSDDEENDIDMPEVDHESAREQCRWG